MLNEDKVYQILLSWNSNPTGGATIILPATSVLDAISKVAKYDVRNCEGKKVCWNDIVVDEVALITILTQIDEPIYPCSCGD
jgi:hypothetical protein